jgi:hypothetical protein
MSVEQGSQILDELRKLRERVDIERLEKRLDAIERRLAAIESRLDIGDRRTDSLSNLAKPHPK